MNIFQKLIHHIRAASTDTLAYAPLAISIGILFIWVVITRLLLNQTNPQGLSLVLVICSAVCSLSGLAQIIRRESPGIVGRPLHGIVPVINGVLTMIFFCGMGLFFLLNLLRER